MRQPPTQIFPTDTSCSYSSATPDGGSSGIGYATAARLLAEGATVFITGRRPAELADAAAKLGERAIGVPGDVTSHADLAHLFATWRG